MTPYHEVSNIRIGDNSLLLIIDGTEYEFAFAGISKRLSNAPRLEREKFELSPSGYGIHWPLLDEDISIDGLLGIKHELPSKLAA